MERDDLVEENEKCAARLDQLTAALQDQREEKSRLANQVQPSLASKKRHRHCHISSLPMGLHRPSKAVSSNTNPKSVPAAPLCLPGMALCCTMVCLFFNIPVVVP